MGNAYPPVKSLPVDSREPQGEETPEGAAEYIASMTDQLAKLARRNGLETLSYILEMARLAADRDNEGEDG
jgi:hypothetical protein